MTTPQGIANAIKRHDLVTDSTLHVVAVVSNPARYHSRYRLFHEFAEAMRATPNVALHVVELAFGDRHHEIAVGDGLSELRLRSSHVLWHKENMINLGVRHLLPRDWKYAAWIDADVFFNTSNWALETIHLLQHYPLVQPWSECADLGPHGGALTMYRSFGGLASRGVQMQSRATEPYPLGHSGYAWACTREFWENTGGLIDFAILGSGDHHMAWGSIGQIERSLHSGISDGYQRRCREWARSAYRVTHGNLACVPGLLQHRWHGSKTKRYYRERWQILIDNKYDPDHDLARDAQGLLYVRGKPQLEHDISRYMSARQEDGVEE